MGGEGLREKECVRMCVCVCPVGGGGGFVLRDKECVRMCVCPVGGGGDVC